MNFSKHPSTQATDAELRRIVESLEALCTLAAVNFPRETNIKVSCHGEKFEGFVLIPSYRLEALLKMLQDNFTTTVHLHPKIPGQ
ncbi:MAG TPA: hypothetical protein VEP90_00565 [Methylomirabilota bacterium]|nr:hypothetical protein [Methylomirabilota bacterium]